MHSRDVLHQDIKPENIFLTEDGSLKIGDLGISKVLIAGERQIQTAGTTFYKPPESFKRQKASLKSDIWSVGCILFELAHQKPLFYGESEIG